MGSFKLSCIHTIPVHFKPWFPIPKWPALGYIKENMVKYNILGSHFITKYKVFEQKKLQHILLYSVLYIGALLQKILHFKLVQWAKNMAWFRE